MTKDIPHDVWLHIASFLPRKALLDLIPVNRAFFVIGMNARYRDISWTMSGPRLLKILVRLRDPAIAYRVRHLRIDCWFLLTHYWSEERKLGWLTQSDILNYLRGITSRGLYISTRKLIREMEKTMKCLTRVTRYDFTCHDLPLTKDTHRLMGYAWKCFPVSLTTLILHARLENFPSLLPTSDIPIHSLHTLNLCFASDVTPLTHEEDAMGRTHPDDILKADIGPFVNRLSSSLVSLEIMSESSSDVSPFIRSLGHFPLLHRLSFHLPFYNEHISDPSAIIIFLSHHIDLMHFELKWSRQWWRKSFRPMLKELSSEVIHMINSDSGILRNLQTLSMFSTQGSSLKATLRIVNRSACFLSALHLHHVFLDYRDISLILDELTQAPNLVNLELPVSRLTPELLDLLKNRLPDLQVLELNFDVLSGDGVAEDDLDKTDAFYNALETRSYEGWKLRDIGVWYRHKSLRRTTSFELRIEKQLVEMIPMVYKVKGIPVTEYFK